MKKIVLFVLLLITNISFLFSNDIVKKNTFGFNFHSSTNILETKMYNDLHSDYISCLKNNNYIYFLNNDSKLLAIKNQNLILNFDDLGPAKSILYHDTLLVFSNHLINLNSGKVILENDIIENLLDFTISKNQFIGIRTSKSTSSEFQYFSIDLNNNTILKDTSFLIVKSSSFFPNVKFSPNNQLFTFDKTLIRIYNNELKIVDSITYKSELQSDIIVNRNFYSFNFDNKEQYLFYDANKNDYNFKLFNFMDRTISDFKYNQILKTKSKITLFHDNYIYYDSLNSQLLFHSMIDEKEDTINIPHIKIHQVLWASNYECIIKSDYENFYFVNFTNNKISKISKLKYPLSDYENFTSDLILESFSAYDYYSYFLHPWNSNSDSTELKVDLPYIANQYLWRKTKSTPNGYLKNFNFAIHKDTIIYLSGDLEKYKLFLNFTSNLKTIDYKINLKGFPTFLKSNEENLFYQVAYDTLFVFNYNTRTTKAIKFRQSIANIFDYNDDKFIIISNDFYKNNDFETGECQSYISFFDSNLLELLDSSQIKFEDVEAFDRSNMIFDQNTKELILHGDLSLFTYKIDYPIQKQNPIDLLKIKDILPNNPFPRTSYFHKFTSIYSLKNYYILTMDTNLVVLFNKTNKTFKVLECNKMYNYERTVGLNYDANNIYNIRYFNNTLYLFSWGGTYFEIKDDILGIDDQKIEEFAEKSAKKTIKLIQYDEFQKLISNNEFTIFDVNGKSLNSSESQNSFKNKLLILRNNSEDFMFYVIE